jgi:hydrogenase/urease accessory protein HupE
VALLDTLEAFSAVALLDTLETFSAVALLDTLEAFSAVAFAFSGWVGSALDAEKFELLCVELSRCVDVVFVVAFGVLLMFEAREECMKLRQIQRQRNR